MLAPRSYLFTSQHTKDSKYDNPRAGKRKNSLPKPEVTATMTPTRTTTSVTEPGSRPITPSSPVVIPLRGHHDESQESHQRPTFRKERHHGRRQRTVRTVHSPDALSPSVAALLAITQIPAQRMGGSTRTRSTGQRLTVDAILQHTGVTEKEYSMSLGRSPLDLLLCPPDELLEDDLAGSETGQESVMSGRTLSSESMPSLEDDCSEASPSLNSLVTPSFRTGRKSRRIRQFSSDSTIADHPLSTPDINIEELDFRVYQKDQGRDQEQSDFTPSAIEQPRRRSAFKSNLTASLRALRSAAKSFSALTTPMITPDDFLTRSIISIDPQVPFTDERMPPRLEDTPTPALRRYLNPTTNAPIEAHVPPSLSQTMPAATKCTASIQMETYKVSRSARGRSSPSVISRRTQITEDAFQPAPVQRQREMRENSDFIRIAVMEMAMRRKGKLDDQKPGRAKWALPPKKESTKKYEIGKDGVPLRWIAQFQ